MKDGLYRKYMLCLLLGVLASNYVDRYVLGLLLQDIKEDLALSDTQLGLVSGIAFALFYSVVGIPIARWADRGNRVTIISIATALWSVAVAMCGAVGSFAQLMAVRVVAGVGEAGLAPPSHSLIADYFKRSERPRAVGIFKMGIPLGVVIGYLCAGWLNEIYGWRVTFFIVGIPGLALALLTALTLREPRSTAAVEVRTGDITINVTETKVPSLREVMSTLWLNRTFRHLAIAYALVVLLGSGISKWQPTFFIRSHGLETVELGAWLALAMGGSGLIGMYLGGQLASRWAANNEHVQLRAMAGIYCAFGFVYGGIFLVSSTHVAFGLMALAALGGNAVVGPLFASIQTLIPERMRGMSIAIMYFCANLLGAGLGPLAVGLLSDAFRPALAEESLRWALIALCPVYCWCAWHFWRASKTVMHDLSVTREIAGDQFWRVTAKGT